jgi:hypothetical protein
MPAQSRAHFLIEPLSVAKNLRKILRYGAGIRVASSEINAVLYG